MSDTHEKFVPLGTKSQIALMRRFKNFWANVSRITVKPSASDADANAVVNAVAQSQSVPVFRA